MASTQSDFAEIELSAAGLAMAGKNGAVRVTNRHMNYLVAAGSSARVLTSEWSRVLSLEKFGGAQIFQIVPKPAAPTPAPAASATTSPSSTSKISPAPEAPQTQVASSAKGEK